MNTEPVAGGYTARGLNKLAFAFKTVPEERSNCERNRMSRCNDDRSPEMSSPGIDRTSAWGDDAAACLARPTSSPHAANRSAICEVQRWC